MSGQFRTLAMFLCATIDVGIVKEWWYPMSQSQSVRLFLLNHWNYRLYRCIAEVYLALCRAELQGYLRQPMRAIFAIFLLYLKASKAKSSSHGLSQKLLRFSPIPSTWAVLNWNFHFPWTFLTTWIIGGMQERGIQCHSSTLWPRDIHQWTSHCRGLDIQLCWFCHPYHF